MLKALWPALAALFTVNRSWTLEDDTWVSSDGYKLPVVSGGAPDDDDDDEEEEDDPSDDEPEENDDDDEEDDTAAGGNDSDLDPEALSKELQKARRQAAKYRTERNSERQRIQALEDQNKAILQALGVTSDEDDDPEARAEALQRENRRLRARQTFNAAARAAGADEDLTWGYLLARGEIDSLDPDSDDFDETVQATIDSALEAKPSLAVSPPPPPKGGADLDDDGNPDSPRPEEMDMADYREWRKNRDKE